MPKKRKKNERSVKPRKLDLRTTKFVKQAIKDVALFGVAYMKVAMNEDGEYVIDRVYSAYELFKENK